MAEVLLSETRLLTVKFDSNITIPKPERYHAAAVKAVIGVLKYAEPEIIYVGDEKWSPTIESQLSDNRSLARVHVFGPVVGIDLLSNTTDILNWFLKQLKKNKEHIVIIDCVPGEAQMRTIIDIYVRAVAMPKRTKVRRINQPLKRFDHAV